MTTIILILIIILCVVIALALMQTKVIDYTTFDYKTDFVADEKGFIWLEITHKGVKNESFKVRFNDLTTNSYEKLKTHGPIEIKCFVSPLFSEARIKEIWIKNQRIR